MSSQRLLIVAYHFPPDAAVGGLRPLKFAKYLPLYGWEPHVLTVKTSYYPSLDQSRLSEVPAQSTIFRTGMLPHPDTIYKRLKASYYRMTGRQREFSRSLVVSSGTAHSNSNGTLENARKLLGSLLWIPPDDVLGWVPIAVLKGIRVLRTQGITHIYTTNPPHSTHLVGLALKALCNVKWVADFRDLWLFDKSFQTRLAARVERWMERKVVENADAITLTTDRMADKFRRTYADVDPTKFVTISNGYDAEDFSSIRPAANPKKFTLTYIGSFYHERTPEPLLRAVSELVAGGKIPADALEIQLIGNCRYVKGRSTEEMAASLGLSSLVRVIDAVPYRRALEYAANSHLLVLLAPDQPYEIPGKAYEYLATGVDVLGLTEDGATADLISKTGGGAVMRPEDIDGMKSAVLQRYMKWTADRPCDRSHPGPPAEIYERRELTRQLAVLLGCLGS
jgi:glycosyltransferase involved in cell wall biosynthesis